MITEEDREEQENDLDELCRDEDDGDCGAYGQQLFSGGSEECEFCSRSAECLNETLAWEKRESQSSNKGEEKT